MTGNKETLIAENAKLKVQVEDLRSRLTLTSVHALSSERWEKRFDSLLCLMEKLADAASKGKLQAWVVMLLPHALIAGLAVLALGKGLP